MESLKTWRCHFISKKARLLWVWALGGITPIIPTTFCLHKTSSGQSGNEKLSHISECAEVKVIQGLNDPVHFWLSHLILFRNYSSKEEKLFLHVFLGLRRQGTSLGGGSSYYKWPTGESLSSLHTHYSLTRSWCFLRANKWMNSVALDNWNWEESSCLQKCVFSSLCTERQTEEMEISRNK